MQRSWLFSVGLATLALLGAGFALESSAQTTQPPPAKGTREMRGRIVRLAPNQVVVRTTGDKEVVVYTNPQTKYLLNNKVVQFSDLRAGSDVAFVYTLNGDRYIANAVTLVPAQAVPAVPGEPTGTLLEGQVVRVIGTDQVILRTADKREVAVYVSPQTTYLFENRPGQFVDLRPGADIGVYYNVRDGRHMAHRVVSRPRRK